VSKKDRFPLNLRRFELFAGCRDAELERIGSLLTQVSLPAGAVVVQQDRHDLQFLVIAEGTARVVRETPDGVDELAVVGPGEVVGELALLDRVPRTATVVAVTPIVAYVATVAEFSGLLDASPTVRAHIERVAAGRRAANLRAA
jgi:CRP-like cAMP-binding protein